eukprot:scaffold138433_cov16-Tisochrysis_lutea.AAC.1
MEAVPLAGVRSHLAEPDHASKTSGTDKHALGYVHSKFMKLRLLIMSLGVHCALAPDKCAPGYVHDRHLNHRMFFGLAIKTWDADITSFIHRHLTACVTSDKCSPGYVRAWLLKHRATSISMNGEWHLSQELGKKSLGDGATE